MSTTVILTPVHTLDEIELNRKIKKIIVGQPENYTLRIEQGSMGLRVAYLQCDSVRTAEFMSNALNGSIINGETINTSVYKIIEDNFGTMAGPPDYIQDLPTVPQLQMRQQTRFSQGPNGVSEYRQISIPQNLGSGGSPYSVNPEAIPEKNSRDRSESKSRSRSRHEHRHRRSRHRSKRSRSYSSSSYSDSSSSSEEPKISAEQMEPPKALDQLVEKNTREHRHHRHRHHRSPSSSSTSSSSSPEERRHRHRHRSSSSRRSKRSRSE